MTHPYFRKGLIILAGGALLHLGAHWIAWLGADSSDQHSFPAMQQSVRSMTSHLSLQDSIETIAEFTMALAVGMMLTGLWVCRMGVDDADKPARRIGGRSWGDAETAGFGFQQWEQRARSANSTLGDDPIAPLVSEAEAAARLDERFQRWLAADPQRQSLTRQEQWQAYWRQAGAADEAEKTGESR